MEQESQEVMNADDFVPVPEGGAGGEELQCEGQEEEEEEEAADGVPLDSSSQSSASCQESSTCSSSQTPGEAPPTGQGNTAISRNSHAKYSTVSYRKIRRGNTKQRIDEFESMMHV